MVQPSAVFFFFTCDETPYNGVRVFGFPESRPRRQMRRVTRQSYYYVVVIILMEQRRAIDMASLIS